MRPFLAGFTVIPSWPMLIEERFPCGQDVDLMCGDPGMPYTMHTCWGSVRCMEWRFQVAERMDAARDEVVRIVHENQASMRLHLRSPQGVTSHAYTFDGPPPPMRPLVVWGSVALATLIMVILLAFT